MMLTWTDYPIETVEKVAKWIDTKVPAVSRADYHAALKRNAELVVRLWESELFAESVCGELTELRREMGNRIFGSIGPSVVSYETHRADAGMMRVHTFSVPSYNISTTVDIRAYRDGPPSLALEAAFRGYLTREIPQKIGRSLMAQMFGAAAMLQPEGSAEREELLYARARYANPRRPSGEPLR